MSDLLECYIEQKLLLMYLIEFVQNFPSNLIEIFMKFNFLQYAYDLAQYIGMEIVQ